MGPGVSINPKGPKSFNEVFMREFDTYLRGLDKTMVQTIVLNLIAKVVIDKAEKIVKETPNVYDDKAVSFVKDLLTELLHIEID